MDTTHTVIRLDPMQLKRSPCLWDSVDDCLLFRSTRHSSSTPSGCCAMPWAFVAGHRRTPWAQQVWNIELEAYSMGKMLLTYRTSELTLQSSGEQLEPLY
jgi:hypothetical protein